MICFLTLQTFVSYNIIRVKAIADLFCRVLRSDLIFIAWIAHNIREFRTLNIENFPY